MMSTNQEYFVEKVGIFTPKPKDVQELNSGEIGFIITGIKNLSETKVGDTICDSTKPLKIFSAAARGNVLWRYRSC